jgi:hypothetical protein
MGRPPLDACGVTTNDLAEMTGRDAKTCWSWLRGRRPIPVEVIDEILAHRDDLDARALVAVLAERRRELA